ncbi:MAG: hypothetical protein L6Q59_01935 [Ignavibacteriaceae bacterium]|nr:hypothetical protein [Ignavibacteriaceae bacterium]
MLKRISEHDVNTYLNRYGYRSQFYRVEASRKFRCAVVIPVYNESRYLPRLLDSIASLDKIRSSDTALIFVVNNPDTAPPEILHDNRQSFSLLSGYRCDSEVFIIDAFLQGRAPEGKNAGVGLARKIGLDAALSLLDYENKKQPFLVCLDGDCTVNRGYLTALHDHYDSGIHDAGVCSYSHIVTGDEENLEAILAYEFYLRYYSLGLWYAGSPLCYHSIGSTMTFTPELYIKCEGMNKRKAGEDFYFLEKAAKHTRIPVVYDAVVYPSSRESERVPFGTGRRIIRHNRNEINSNMLYDFTTFEIIKKWQNVTQNFTLSDDPESVFQSALSIHTGLYEFLNQNGFFEVINKIRKNSKTDLQLKKQVSGWMDSFRMLKLIHYIRDHHLPEKPVSGGLQRLCNAIKIEYHAEPGTEAATEKRLELLRLLQGVKINQI